MGKSKIEWTNKTWNPITGCTEVSPGCDHCYARDFAERWRGIPGHPYEHGFDVMLRPERLNDPFTWRKPSKVFVNSMSDLFHKDIPDAFIDRVFAVMGATPQHTYQVLTKRPERMRRYLRDLTTERMLVAMRDGMTLPGTMPFPNVWLGVSIESNDYAWRADMLREAPAAVRFLSVEPMLGPVDAVDLAELDWVICGGESGHGARPMSGTWARDLRDRCAAAGVAFFFKQLGSVLAKESGIRGKGDNIATFPADLRVRDYPTPPIILPGLARA
jgi:protein gp37